MSVRSRLGLGVGSIEAVRSGLGVPRPASLRDLLARYSTPVEFDQDLTTPDGVALGGHHHIRLERQGRVRHSGHMRATGFPSFDYSVRTVIGNGTFAPAVLAVGGRVHGTNEVGDRESNWDLSEDNSLIALNWLGFKSAEAGTEINWETDWFGSVADVIGFLATLVAGFVVGGPAGAYIMVGVHAADAAGLDEHLGVGGLAGVGVAGGVLFIFGPGAILPAIVAGAAIGAAVDLLVEHRPMNDEEVGFADQIFRGTLPVDRIRLTNMLGIGKRPFVFPSVGDTILVNLGEGFGSPTTYRGTGDPDKPKTRAPGQLFIHELTHTWQIAAKNFLPGWLCEATITQAANVGDSAYQYGPADRPFSNFNIEQQGKIVEHWFAGDSRQIAPGPSGPRGMLEDDANPYWRYIRDNIRTRFT